MQITKTALEMLKKIIKEDGRDSGIRIFISGVGCCGPSFGLDVSDKGEPGDNIITNDGLKIFISKEAEEKLSGATIDASEKGFIIRDLPASSSSCCS